MDDQYCRSISISLRSNSRPSLLLHLRGREDGRGSSLRRGRGRHEKRRLNPERVAQGKGGGRGQERVRARGQRRPEQRRRRGGRRERHRCSLFEKSTLKVERPSEALDSVHCFLSSIFTQFLSNFGTLSVEMKRREEKIRFSKCCMRQGLRSLRGNREMHFANNNSKSGSLKTSTKKEIAYGSSKYYL